MSGAWWKNKGDLKAEQLAVLDVPADQNLFISGPPGSGKTNLLLLRANLLTRSDYPNLTIVVFTSLLKKFIETGSSQYDFPPEKVVTHAAFFNHILREHHRFVDSKLSFDDARTKRIDELKKLIDEGVLGELYQAILLDEAQDYLPEEISIFRHLAPILIVSADHRQKIYSGADSIETLKKLVPTQVHLKHHYRNGKKICLLADGVMMGKPDHESMLKTSNYDEKEYPSSVDVFRGLSLKQQGDEIVKRIQNQLTIYPNELIGVICPKAEEVDALAKQFATSAIAKAVTVQHEEEFDMTKPVWLATINSSKGLEFRTLHLAGCDSIERFVDRQRRLTFTAITRCKTALSIYYEKRIPGFFEAGLAQVEPRSTKVIIDEAFGKKS